MKKVLFAAAVLFLLPLVCLFPQNKRLVIYTWEEMIPQEVFDDFTRETGVEVILETFEYNEDMLVALEMAEGGGIRPGDRR